MCRLNLQGEEYFFFNAPRLHLGFLNLDVHRSAAVHISVLFLVDWPSFAGDLWTACLQACWPPTQCTAHTMAILCSVLLQTARFSKSRFSQVLKYTFFLNRTAQIFFSIKILFLIFSHFSCSSEVIIFCFLEWSFTWLLVPPHVLHVTSTMAWLYAVSFFCFFTLFLDSICR